MKNRVNKTTTSMALWQINFFVLPKSALDELIKPKYENQESFDDSILWSKLQINSDFFDPISNYLPKGKSWSGSIILYGEENSNRLEVCTENGIIESVTFRIDFTSNYELILKSLIEFFIQNNLIVLDNNLNPIDLNYESIKAAIESSESLRIYNVLSNGSS